MCVCACVRARARECVCPPYRGLVARHLWAVYYLASFQLRQWAGDTLQWLPKLDNCHALHVGVSQRVRVAGLVRAARQRHGVLGAAEDKEVRRIVWCSDLDVENAMIFVAPKVLLDGCRFTRGR